MILNTFNKIEDHTLRNFNRVVMFRNLEEQWGSDVCKQYLEMIDNRDIVHMLAINSCIKKFGIKQVRQHIMENTKFTDDEKWADV